MSMMHKRDAPTFYRLVNKNGEVVEVVPKGKVFKRKRELEKQHGPLRIMLVETA